jgi:hypothetical protein
VSWYQRSQMASLEWKAWKQPHPLVPTIYTKQHESTFDGRGWSRCPAVDVSQMNRFIRGEIRYLSEYPGAISREFGYKDISWVPGFTMQMGAAPAEQEWDILIGNFHGGKTFLNCSFYRGLAVTSRDDVIDGCPPYWRYFFHAAQDVLIEIM